MAIIAGRKTGRSIKQRTIRPVITAVVHSCKSTIPEGISVAKVPPSIKPVDITTPPICLEAKTSDSLAGI